MITRVGDPLRSELPTLFLFMDEESARMREEEKVVRIAALRFCKTKHRQQRRADGSPYWRHPQSVGKIAYGLAIRYFRAIDPIIFPNDMERAENLYLGGLMHDTIEDCGVTYEEVAQVTNIQVADLVSAVSEDHRLSIVPRRIDYANRLGLCTLDAKILKLADLVHNLSEAHDLIRSHPETARSFLRGWPASARLNINAIEPCGRTRGIHHAWKWSFAAVEAIERSLAHWRSRIKQLTQHWPGPPPGVA